MAEMSGIVGLVAAAGRGTRSGLPYPKTLYPLQGRPILSHIAELISQWTDGLVVVASPDGETAIRQCLVEAGIAAEVTIQAEPRGMGDAVLCGETACSLAGAENVLLIWGDVPFIQASTVKAVVAAHRVHGNDFTFATALVDSAYTIVARDPAGHVIGVVETREENDANPMPGERDIGLFLFRKDLVLKALREDLPGKHGKSTGEHGFLYVIRHLAARGLKVEALPIASELDLVSLNSLDDVTAFL